MSKICEECGQPYREQQDDFLHGADDDHQIYCRKFFNGIKLTTELNRVNCPECRLQIAAPALLEACEEYIEWFERISRYQDQRLGHGLKEACQTWGEASTIEPFDCTKMKATIAQAKE